MQHTEGVTRDCACGPGASSEVGVPFVIRYGVYVRVRHADDAAKPISQIPSCINSLRCCCHALFCTMPRPPSFAGAGIGSSFFDITASTRVKAVHNDEAFCGAACPVAALRFSRIINVRPLRAPQPLIVQPPTRCTNRNASSYRKSPGLTLNLARE